MPDSANYYIITKDALPEIFIDVLKVKKLIDQNEKMTIQEAVESVGISRSSYYKYKDCIFPLYDSARGKNVTLFFKMDDKPGLLSKVLNKFAEIDGNILTIHQSIPINGIATITITVEMREKYEFVDQVIESLEQIPGIYKVKIIARE